MEYSKIALKNKDKEIVDYAIIDNENLLSVSEYGWCKTVEGYANGTINKKPIRMHQFIIGKAPIGQIIDHINGNKLDNRRINLRFATKSQNGQNIKKQENTSSQYKGVCFNISSNKWLSGSRMNCKAIRLGVFDTEIEAAKMYDTFVLLHHGTNSKTNGLVNYEDIKNIDIHSLIKKKTKVDNDLPEYIYRIREYFHVTITYNKIKYKKTVSTLDCAIKQLEIYKKEIEQVKEVEKDKHYKLTIIRNEKRDAILPVKNIKGIIIDNLIVSDNRWHDCMLYTWSKNKNYFRATVDSKMTKIHHYIMGVSGDQILVDHIDHNPNNNKDDNLRLSNSVNNNHNRTKKTDCSSQYLGVSYNKPRRKFYAKIKKEGINYHIGSFEDEKDAAIAYNKKAQELYGEFANLNIID